jgi:ABC-type multidrug transport system ATPase subunit
MWGKLRLLRKAPHSLFRRALSLSLKITGLSKTYPNGVKALKDLTLTIGNHMFGLLGPNGAGKSTLMRTV